MSIELKQLDAKRSGERYSAPALEKGLDILEALSDQMEGLTQKQVAERVGRSTSEIFRMLACLEQRGYVRRDAPTDAYRLTPRMFELSHRHPPTKRLLDAALPIMRTMARQARQSCHLAVLHSDTVLVVSQVDSPEPRGFSVRLGASLPVLQTSSGSVLLAWADPRMREEILARMLTSSAERAAERLRLEAIAHRGFERRRSSTIRGIIDLSFPICGHTGFAVAALSVPCLSRRGVRSDARAVQELLSSASRELISAIGGRKP